MTERKLCGNCDYQKSVGVSIACQRCFNKSLWKERSKTMTEELEKEAREKYHNHKTIDFQGFYNHHYYYLGYVESAEPREKRIEELEVQIEKMRCCENCAWWYKLPNGQRDCAETCENLDNWSLRR